MSPTLCLFLVIPNRKLTQTSAQPRPFGSQEFQEPLVLQSAGSFCHDPFSDILFVLVPLPRRLCSKRPHTMLAFSIREGCLHSRHLAVPRPCLKHALSSLQVILASLLVNECLHPLKTSQLSFSVLSLNRACITICRASRPGEPLGSFERGSGEKNGPERT